MPSPIGHVIAGVAAGWLVSGAPKVPATSWRETALFGALAALPDIDLIAGAHSGPTHSLGASAIVGMVAWLLARRVGARRAGWLALACVAAYASHVLLDWLGSDSSPPIGVMALWPFSRAYYESDLHVFMAISRRYYQGWRFVSQNILAVCLELAILMPILVGVWRFRLARSAGCALVIMTLGSAAVPAEARAQSQAGSDAEARAYDDLLGLYRSGEVEPAVKALTKLLEADGGQRQAMRWIGQARDRNRRAHLEAALLLFTDAILLAWQDDHPFPVVLIARYTAPLMDLRSSLKRMDPRTPFLRIWYLLWESFRQVHVNQSIPFELDFLAEALDAFPDDAQILLAAGSRHQLTWWMSLENAQRDPDNEPPAVRKFLMEARGYLRRSLKADAEESEARLRLVNVLLQLNDIEDVPGLLTAHNWTADGPAFEYLARLFEGDLHERRGNRPAAAAAYDRAIALVAVPQAAQVARAHLAHLEGQRSESAAILAPALANRDERTDPWWPYIRGQAWRFEPYLKMAHAMVMK